jgi:hypothetical protein
MYHNARMDSDWKRQLDALHAGLVSSDDPAAWVAEADAVDASERYPHVAVRGPVFGVAAQDASAGRRGRLVQPVMDGTPQQARDGLNSSLWFRAKDGTDDPAVRRELLAAVAVLEREPVNELEVLGVRYRVVRADEFARSGDDGLEPPRPTDTEPLDASWDGDPSDTRPADEGHLLDPRRPEGVMTGALRLALQDFAYTGTGFSTAMRADSRKAIGAYPDIALLPVGFGVTENSDGRWRPHGILMATPHDARRLLHTALTESWPLLHRFDDRRREVYARAAAGFRAARRADELLVEGRQFRISRIQRMVRYGPDGPEPPRPSDLDSYGPMKLHPTMDEDGTVHFED